VAVSPTGALFVSEQFGCRIRQIVGGVITTVVGTGTCASSGDGGPATAATMSYGLRPGV
jgi:hypothetical protein